MRRWSCVSFKISIKVGQYCPWWLFHIFIERIFLFFKFRLIMDSSWDKKEYAQNSKLYGYFTLITENNGPDNRVSLNLNLSHLKLVLKFINKFVVSLGFYFWTLFIQSPYYLICYASLIYYLCIFVILFKYTYI